MYHGGGNFQNSRREDLAGKGKVPCPGGDSRVARGEDRNPLLYGGRSAGERGKAGLRVGNFRVVTGKANISSLRQKGKQKSERGN